VFLKSGFPECSWSRLFDKYHSMAEVSQILGKYLVIAVIDTENMPDGNQVFSKYCPPGAPSWVIADTKQKVIVDSFCEGNNVGYPLAPNETEWYVKGLRK